MLRTHAGVQQAHFRQKNLYAQRVLQKTGYGYNTFHEQKGGESIVSFHESEDG